MRTDFQPVHLKEANAKLDDLLSSYKEQEEFRDPTISKSMWQKFLGLFKRNPFELPEDIYKLK